MNTRFVSPEEGTTYRTSTAQWRQPVITMITSMDATKTHMMVIDAESDADQVITIAGKAIGRVERFKFLGSIVTNDSNSSTEINVRLAIARQVMRQLTEIWKSAEISLKLKKQIVKSLVWSIS